MPSTRFSIIITIIFIIPLPSLIRSFDDSSEEISVNTGESAKLTCDLPERYSNKQADFYGPSGRLLSVKTGDLIINDDRTRLTLEHEYAWTWSLIISDISDEDAGEYTCRVTTDDRTLTIIKRFNLTVLTPPKILDITIESNNHGFIRENDQVILKCLVRGNPPPKIVWVIPEIKSSLLNQPHERNIILYGNKLLIRNFSRTTPRDYQCIADNGIPPRDTRTRYVVPAISPETNIQLSLSRSATQILLICTVIARPLVFAKWKYNHREMIHVKRLEINDYTVQLTLLLPIDFSNLSGIFGVYECQAENQLKSSKSAILIDDSILSNLTSSLLLKQTRISSTSSSSATRTRTTSPSYAQIELLLTGSSSRLSYSFYLFWSLQWVFYTFDRLLSHQ